MITSLSPDIAAYAHDEAPIEQANHRIRLTGSKVTRMRANKYALGLLLSGDNMAQLS